LKRIAVIGSGSYGTCLAILAAGKGHEVALWCRTPETADAISQTRQNAAYLPGATIPEQVEVTSDLERAVKGASLVLSVTPSHATRDVLGRAATHMTGDTIVVNASKGLEEKTYFRMDEVFSSVLPDHLAGRSVYLSGPTFAKEVAQGQPSAIVVAGRDTETTREVQEALSTDRFRVYSSEDVVGVLVGGALKNVVAIAAGISDGLGFGHNARAALITRGLAEISRIGVSMGADPLTFAGLSGLGDLVLTCAGDLSRNRRVGIALGEGKKLDDVIAEMKMVAEGVKTTRVAYDLTRKLAVRAPITEVIYAILYEERPARQAIVDLMSRSLKAEQG
jgi:glycerol-3-phosphate dehydrogenase (NAD(P)+)